MNLDALKPPNPYNPKNVYLKTKWAVQDRFKGVRPTFNLSQREARMAEINPLPKGPQTRPIKSSFTSRAKQAFQLSQREARMADINPLPKGPQVRPTKSSFTSRAKQAFKLSQQEARIGQVLQPKVKLPVSKKISGKLGSVKLGSLGKIGKLGLGIGAGIIGDLIQDGIKQNRRPGDEEFWGIADTVSDLAAFGASAINPLLGIVAKPLIEATLQSAKEGARQGMVAGAMGAPKDDAEFLEYVVKNNIQLPASFEEQDKMKKEWLASQQDGGVCERVYIPPDDSKKI